MWMPEKELYFCPQCATESVNTDCIAGGRTYRMDSNYTLTPDFMQQYGICRPLNKFRWGFSSLALLTYLLTTWSVALVLPALHFDALRNDQLDKHVFDGNFFSDAVVISRELENLEVDRPLDQVPPPELKKVAETAQAIVIPCDYNILRSRTHPRLDGRLKAAPDMSARPSKTVQFEMGRVNANRGLFAVYTICSSHALAR